MIGRNEPELLVEEAKEYELNSEQLLEKTQKEAGSLDAVWARFLHPELKLDRKQAPEEKLAETRLKLIEIRFGFDRDPNLTLWHYVGISLFGTKMPTGVAESQQVFRNTAMTAVQKYEKERDIIRKSQARAENDGSLISRAKALWTWFFRAPATIDLYKDMGHLFDGWDADDARRQQMRMKKS